MNVLYISYDGMTDPLGQSQVIPYLCGLSKKGHTIHLISCEKIDKFKIHRKSIDTLLESNDIVWHPVPYSILPSVLSKQLNLFHIKQKALGLCRDQVPDIIHCRSYMASLIGLQLKHKFNTKLIFDMRGFWADERVDGNIWSLKNILQKRIYIYFKKKEIEFLSTADYTISLTENAKKEILSWKQFQQKPIPIEVIPCCVDLHLFSTNNINSLQQQELRKRLAIREEDIVMSYLGSIGTWYLLDEMLDFFTRLLLAKPKARFLFITPDDENSIYEKALAKEISKDRIIVQSARRTEVPAYLNLSQFSLYFIKPVYSKKASSPTKTGEIMALGIPIVTNSGIGDSDKIITDSGAGLLIYDFSTMEYDRIINQIDVLLAIEKTKIIATAKKHFSLECGVELYDSVYKKLNTTINR